MIDRIKGKVKGVYKYGIRYFFRKHIDNVVDKLGIKGMSHPIRYYEIKRLQRMGGATPLVSIIIPVYNVELYIRQTMDSLLSQNMEHIEIIAVDDGSTDNSLQILKEYEKKDSRVRVFCQKNKYAGVARNVGIDNAKGEYLIFVDSDDFFSENLARDAYFTAKMKNADIVLFGANHFNNVTGKYDDAKWLLKAYLAPNKKTFCYKDCKETLYEITTPCPWTKIFRREFVIESGLYYQEIQNTNDLYFVYTALAKAKRITVLDKKLVNYRVGITTSLQATKKKNPLCFYEAYKAWHDELVKSGVMEELHRGYVNETLNGCLYNLKSIKDVAVKEQVFNVLKNEAFKVLDLENHDKSFYKIEEDYEHMRLIINNDFEKYMSYVQN